jgi:hypothetical protein
MLFPIKPTLPPKPIMTIKKAEKKQKQNPPTKKYKKKPIPTALREAVWIVKCGRVFEHKCNVHWCPNVMTAFDFQAGHNVPESKGGPTNMDNLIPICGRCNNSMGDRYTIDEWNLILGGHQTALFPNPLPTLQGLREEKNSHEHKEERKAVVIDTPVKKGWCRFFCCFS